MEVWCLNLWTSKEAPRHTINGDFMHNEESLFSHARKAYSNCLQKDQAENGRGGEEWGKEEVGERWSRGGEQRRQLGRPKKKNTQDVAMMAG